MALAQGDAGRLAASLAKLDAASAKFTSAQAEFSKDIYNKLGGDHEIQEGSVYFLKTAKGTQAGVKFGGKDARTISYVGGVVRIFNPAQKCVDTVDGKVNKAKIDSFLTLGFGSSGKDLAAAWEIKDLGVEPVGGVKAEKLEMVAKDAGVRSQYSKVTLWMDLERGVSVKQVLQAPTGDLNTALYSKIRLNEKVETKPFEFKGGACNK